MGISSASAPCVGCLEVFPQTTWPQNWFWRFFLSRFGHTNGSRFYWLSHRNVVINRSEPSCEKSKKCSLAANIMNHVLLLSPWLSLFPSLSASVWMPPLSNVIALRLRLRKFQLDSGLIPRLTLLTLRTWSALLSPQSHSTICKSSGPQWTRVAPEEEHKVNMAMIIRPVPSHVCVMFTCLCDTVLAC